MRSCKVNEIGMQSLMICTLISWTYILADIGLLRFAVVPHFPHPLHPLNVEMPRDQGKDSASAPDAQLYLESRGEDADRPASSRTTLGCFTCRYDWQSLLILADLMPIYRLHPTRIRKKKCPNTNGIGPCEACLTLRVECLGYGKKRPRWMIVRRHLECFSEIVHRPDLRISRYMRAQSVRSLKFQGRSGILMVVRQSCSLTTKKHRLFGTA